MNMRDKEQKREEKAEKRKVSKGVDRYTQRRKDGRVRIKKKKGKR